MIHIGQSKVTRVYKEKGAYKKKWAFEGQKGHQKVKNNGTSQL